MPIDVYLDNLQPGERVAKRFDISDALGGGPGYFSYRAYDRDGHDWVALRLLSPEVFADLPDRNAYRHTVATLKASPHPQVAPLLEYGTEAEFEWITFGWLEGVTLIDVMRARSRLAWAEVVWLLEPLVSACEYAATSGLIGLDLTMRPTLLARAANARDGTSQPSDALAQPLDALRGINIYFSPLFTPAPPAVAGNYVFQPADPSRSARGIVALIYDLLGSPPQDLNAANPRIVSVLGEKENALLRRAWASHENFSLRDFAQDFRRAGLRK